MKSLRYLTEFFADAVEGAKPKKFPGRMEELQADLGELNDIFVHAGDAPLDPELQRRADRAMEAAEGHWAAGAVVGLTPSRHKSVTRRG